jgi:type VI secretion system secreted protein Hcp
VLQAEIAPFADINSRIGGLAMAAVDYFLKLEGIEGESQDEKHKNEIHIESFSFGVSNVGTGGYNLGSGAGKASFQDISFNKRTDKASTNLQLACASGKHIANGLFTARKAGEKPVEFLKIKLTEVFVSSWNVSGHGEGGITSESFTINFSKIETEYTPQKADGTPSASVHSGWDVKANKKI